MGQTARTEPGGAGGAGELLRLAWPLILSNSIWTLQIALDRILLGKASSDAIAAALPAALVFWTPIILFQYTANYATTFVAQYTGAGQSPRVGPAVWQSLYFSAVAGVAFLGLIPLAEPLMALGGHSGRVQELEVTYFRCLCFAALPTLLSSAASSFFAGRGESRIVLLINGAGLLVNGLSAYGLIFGTWGLPTLGIAGAGWATVLGTSTSACLSLVLMLLPRYEAIYATRSGWKFDGELFRRLLWFGLPNGMFAALDVLVFTIFVFLVGRLGDVELAATNIAFTLNTLAFLPALGIGQAVSILVGQRLGENRPDLAARSAWSGSWVAFLYMASIALVYLLFPDTLAIVFRSQQEPGKWELVAALVPALLRFVAFYSLFDSMNLVFSFALRGAGDTRFVTAAALVLSGPVLVLPTWAAWRYDWGLYWAWTFATLYVVLLALAMLARFRQGRWQAMRVIESHH
jgi:MATE family multidrug resistance protein